MDETLELVIQDLSRGGAGVARDPGGRAVFVHGTAPGDRVRVRVTEEHKRYAQAELIELIEPSPQRIAPRCAVFGQCGGCQWQHLPYSLQWQTKVRGALHALARVGFDAPESWVRQEFSAKNPWNYRNRIQLRGGDHGVGFYARGSHQVVPIQRCEIAREEINRELFALSEQARQLAEPSKVEVEVGPKGGAQASWNARHAALGFRQVNDEQNQALQEWIAGQLPASGGVLYDLYGGAGNLSQGVASRFREVHVVDTGAPAGEASDQVRYHRKDVGRWLKAQLKQGVKAEAGSVILLDPPREGCGEALPVLAEFVQALRAERVIAVGCDPDSWAKDLWKLHGRLHGRLQGKLQGRWKIDSLAFFDFFPQTVHLESVASIQLRFDTGRSDS